MAELVADKERANFCEYFKPGAAALAGSALRFARSPGASERAKLEELFKRK